MLFADMHVRVPLHGTDHRDIRIVFDHGTQLGLVAAAAHLVEDHTGNPDVGIERLVTKNQWRHPPGHALGIQHQYDRAAELGGQRRIAVGTLEIEPVEQSLVTLDKTDIRTLQCTAEQALDLVPLHGVEIEVIAGAAGRLRQPQRIDVVRAPS